jgi:NAD(P)-dependent dehydrogenase (short-subunit alcohol dehydrogenase family)
VNDHAATVVVITGSARGIGLGLAAEFLRRGCRVMISDMRQDAIDSAVLSLSGADRCAGQVCDVTDIEQLRRLWQSCCERFGRVDIWINNAGVGSDQTDIVATDAQLLSRVMDVNIGGVVFGSQVAMQGMRTQASGGAIYNTAGFGSNGFWRRGMTIYGTSKRAVAYFSKGLAREAVGSKVIVGWLNPGMVVTPLVIEEAQIMTAQQWAAGRKVFNMWGETIETTAQQLVPRILNNKRSGVNLHLLPGWKMAWKALRFVFVRRDLFSAHGV